jgi:hypothetical protein
MAKRRGVDIRSILVSLLSWAMLSALWKWFFKGVFDELVFAPIGDYLRQHVPQMNVGWFFSSALALLGLIIPYVVLGLIVWLLGRHFYAAGRKATTSSAPAPRNVELPKIADPKPDTPIYQAIAIIDGRSLQSIDARELRDKLALGRIHAWARPMKTNEDILVPVPPETWQAMTFMIMRPWGRQPLSRIVPAPDHWHQATHYDVMLSALEIDQIWPGSNLEWLTLRDAAQVVYDETRHALLSGMSRHMSETDDEILRQTAEDVFHHAVHVRGRLPAATSFDELSQQTRGPLVVFDNMKAAGHNQSLRPEFSDVEVRSDSLSAIIDRIKKVDVDAGFSDGEDARAAATDSSFTAEVIPPLDLPGMVFSDRDDFDLVPAGLVIKGTRTDDGIDVFLIIRYRNRSMATITVKPLEAKVRINDKMVNSTGINGQMRPETTDSVRFKPIRLYNDIERSGEAIFVAMFGGTKETMRTAIEIRWSFTMREYPPKGVAGPVKAEAHHVARYFVNENPEKN